ncbi:inorganic pyrophosphatase [Chironomus tepperi]|uniref:inorganic pyrophosphatase n=1 Tax=Chironomus tepperi TaxID=113505 RepID=UPI00391EF88D
MIKKIFHCSFVGFSNINLIQVRSLARMAEKFEAVSKGAYNSKDYRVFFKNAAGTPISPLHDIPLYANNSSQIFNMVVEVPRWTNAKMEITLGEELNPIKQDIKKEKLRFVANIFPHHGYIWNYGALPQTWEYPEHIDKATGCRGDNDPIDVCEIGSRVAKRGDVIQVKVLGTLALIDEGETDWKVLAIDVNDPVADKMEDVQDIEKFFPGLLRATVEWFKFYKVPDGKPENQFAFNSEAKNAAFAKNIINETHTFWQRLINKEVESNKISCSTVANEGTPFTITSEQAEEAFSKATEGGDPEPYNESINKWHFIHLQ